MTNQRRRPQRRRGIASVILALLLLAMAAGQLADFPGFVDTLGDYDIGGSPWTWIVAVCLVVGESIGGVSLLLGSASARQMGAVVALAVAFAWSTLALSAFVRSEVVQNCGCFGVFLGQPLRWWILLEDAEFLALSAWVLVRERVPASPGSDTARTGFRTGTSEGATDVRAPQAS